MLLMTEHSDHHRSASSSSSEAVKTKAKSPKQVSVSYQIGRNQQSLSVVAIAAKQPSPLFLAARHWTRCSRLPVQNTRRLGHLFRCSRSSQHVFLGNHLNEGRQKAKRRLSTITLSTLLLILPLFQKHLVSTSKSDNTNSTSSQPPPTQRQRQQQQQQPPPLPRFTTITNDFIPIDQQRMMLFPTKHNTADELAIADFNIDNEILGKINNVIDETVNMSGGQINNNKNGTYNDDNNNSLEFNLFGIKFDPKMPLLQSAKNRQGLVKHIFNEFHEKTLSLQATSAGGLSDETGVALATGTANQQLPINSSHPLVNSSTMLGSTAADSADDLQERQTQVPAGPRPFFGDVFQSFFAAYLPYHCVIGLVICCLGIFANITNIIVLTRPNMITAVNTILCAMAFSDLVVNISNIGFLTHGLLDATNLSSFYSLPWAIYILLHAHASVTGHTISMWLTCLLATWRYFVVCRSQSNQRNWSVRLALRIITAVLLLVPIFCIPNYLAFDIDVEIRQNMTLYTVGFSSLAKRVQVFKTLHFWIFSCLTKLLPCFLLTFFTTALIRKLLSARERRLRLATYGGNTKEDTESAEVGRGSASASGSVKKVILSESHLTSEQLQSPDGGIENGKETANNVIVETAGKSNDTRSVVFIQAGSISNESGKGAANVQVSQHRNSSCATNQELIALSCNSSECGSTTINNNNNHHLVTSSSKSNNNNNNNNGENKQQVVNQARILTQLIVARTPTSETISTTVAPCQTDTQFHVQPVAAPYLSPSQAHDNHLHTESPRSASTCGALDFYGASTESVETKLFEIKPLVRNSRAASQEFPRKIMNNGRVLSNSTNIASDGNLKFSSNSKRSSAAMTPTQLIKSQAAQRQLSHNETTTRLLIAVMIVFVICEFPAGVLAALCAVFGEGFFENVYQPVGHLTDLLALINSSVNFILYCCMSTQFRKTFYKVVLRC